MSVRLRPERPDSVRWTVKSLLDKELHLASGRLSESYTPPTASDVSGSCHSAYRDTNKVIEMT